MFSFLASSAPRTDTSSTDELVFEDGRSGLTILAPTDSNLMSLKVLALPTAEDLKAQRVSSTNNTLMNPPLHWHVRQTEHFLVTSGSMLVTVESETKTLNEIETLTVMPGQHHKLTNDSETEDLVVRVDLDDPQDRAKDEAFFRSLHMYQEDARKHGKSPSFFQLSQMMHTAGCVVVLPGPKMVLMPAGRLLTWVVGSLIGKRLLGYKASYPEYYSPPSK